MFQLNNIKSNISSILGPEVEIKGDVTVSGDLLIYGKVYGDILSKGEIISAKGSKVVGNIYAHNASISGKIEGNLEVESKAIENWEDTSPLRDQYGNALPMPSGRTKCHNCGKEFDDWNQKAIHIEIVHNLTGISKKDIYQKALKLKHV